MVKKQWPYFTKIYLVKQSVIKVPSDAPLGISVLFDPLDSIGSGSIQLVHFKSRSIINNFNRDDFSSRSTTE